MKIITKYNAGDIVLFYNKSINENDIGMITGVSFKYDLDPSIKFLEDRISPVKIVKDFYDNRVEVDETNIMKKLNKKAFEKAFAEKCAKYLTHKHKDKGES